MTNTPYFKLVQKCYSSMALSASLPLAILFLSHLSPLQSESYYPYTSSYHTRLQVSSSFDISKYHFCSN